MFAAAVLARRPQFAKSSKTDSERSSGRSNARRRILAASVAALLLPVLGGATKADAADYTWNQSGPSNFWDTSTANWTGAGTVWVNGSTNRATFNTPSESVSLTTGITANQLLFNTPAVSGYNVTTSNGSILTLAGSGAGIDVSSTSSASIGVVLAGNNGLTKTGGGSVTLNAASSYTGLTDIQAGTLAVTMSNALVATNDMRVNGSFRILSGTSQAVAGLTGSGVVTVAGTNPGTTFTVSGSAGGSTFLGAIVDNGGTQQAVIKTGNGTQTFGGSGTSTYSAGTTINAGTLIAAKNTAFGTGNVLVAGGATWGLSGGITQSNIGAISGSGAAGSAGAIANISGSNTLSGQIALSGNATVGTTAGSLALNGGVDLGTKTATFDAVASAPITVGSVITGSGSVIKNGAGTLTLTAANTYGGITNVNAGALIVNGSTMSTTNVGNGGTLGGTGSIASTVNVFNGGTLQASQANNLAVTSLFLDGGSRLALTLGAPNTGVAAVSVALNLDLGGVLNITDGGGFGYGTYRLIDYGGTLTDSGLTVGSVPVGFNPGSMSVDTGTGGQVNLVVNAAITEQYWDGGNLSPSLTPGGAGGSGTWNTTLTNWTNAAGNVNGPWASQDAVFGGAAGTVTVGAPVTVDKVLMVTDNYFFTSSGGNSIEFNQWRGGLTTGIGGDLNIIATSSNAVVDGTMKLQDNAVLTAQVNQALTGGSIELQGESKVTQNDVEGIAGGNFIFSAAQGGSGGILELNGFDAVVNSLASTGGAGIVRNGGASDVTLKVNQATNTIFDGLITDGGGGIMYFNKQGAGTLTITGTMTTRGTVTVDGGTFEVAGTGNVDIGNAGVAVGSAGDGTFKVSGGGKMSSRDVDLGVGQIGHAVITGVGSQWDANFFTVGRITSGDLQVLDGGVLNTSRGYVGSASSGLATVSGAGSQWNSTSGILIAFDVGGTGTLTVTDGGKVTTNQIEIGNNGGTGGIQLEGTAGSRGVIEVGAIVRQGGTATIDADGGVLRATGSTANFLQNFNAGDVTLGTGGLFFDTNGFDVGLTNVLDGAGALTKQGAGTFTLSGANTYQGGTNLTAGKLVAANNSALGTGTLTMADGTTLSALSASRTLANAITLDGNVTFEAFSSMTLTGTIDLGASDRTITLVDDSNVILEGSVTGDGGLKVVASSTSFEPVLEMTGAVSNTYTGLTQVGDAATLYIHKNSGAVAILGDVQIDAGGLLVADDNGSGVAQIAATSKATVNGELLFGGFVSDFSQTLANLDGAGFVTNGDTGVGPYDLSLTVQKGNFSGVIREQSGAGALKLIKDGVDVLILTGANTFTGGTTINNGTLLANNTTGSATGTGAVTINNGGTLGGNGKVSGPVTLSSGGTIAPGSTATGISTTKLTISSLTMDGGSTLAFQLGADDATSDLLVVDGALTKGTAGTHSVAISDAGGIGSQNRYTLATFTSTDFLATDFTLSLLPPGVAAALVMDADSLDLVLSITLNGRIIQNSAPVGTPTFADFLVEGEVTTGGPYDNNTINSLTFTPGSSLLIHNTLFVTTGPVNLVGGSSLQLDGTLSANQLNVLFGGWLHGNGTIAGNLINSGLLSPGNSPGTIRVTKDYIQTSSGTLRIEIGGRKSGQHDLLAVDGTAYLDGALQLVRLDKFKLKRGDKISFLTAGSGVEGTFARIENAFVSDTILQPTVVYGDHEVSLEAIRGSFETYAENAGLTPNQRSVARTLDSVSEEKPNDQALVYLDQRTLEKLPGDFDKIAPEELTSIFTISTALANVQGTNLQRRADDIRHGSGGFSASGLAMQGNDPSYSGGLFGGAASTGVAGPTGNEGKISKEVLTVDEKKWGAFVTGTGEWVDVDGDGNARGYDINTGGFTLGLDYKVTESFVLGLAAGYTGTTADLADDGRVWVNGGKLGLYSTWFTGGFYVDAAVTGGYNSFDTKRSGLQGAARGSTEGGEINVLVGTGYDWKVGALSIGPTATFQYTLAGMDSFTEHGSLAPLDIESQNAESVRTTFGFKASYDWKCGGMVIRPELRAAWQHEYGDKSYDLSASFANGAGDSFLTRGPELGRDSLLLGAGVAVQCSDRTSIYAYYDGELGRENYDRHSVSAGIRLAF